MGQDDLGKRSNPAPGTMVIERDIARAPILTRADGCLEHRVRTRAFRLSRAARARCVVDRSQ
jgi:hypothetical protein